MDEKRGWFEAQVLPHLDAAYRFACYLSSTPSDADDILQEAIFRALRGFDTLRGTHVNASLMAIVRQCQLTAVSQQQKHAFVRLPQEDDAQDGHAMISTTPGPERDSIRRDEGRTLDRLMAALPEEHREILVLREIEDMGYREIAQVTNVPIGTVMSRLARARASLKTQWEKEVAGEARAVR